MLYRGHFAVFIGGSGFGRVRRTFGVVFGLKIRVGDRK